MVWTANWGALPLGLAPVRFILRQEAVRRINGLCRYVSRPGGGGWDHSNGMDEWCSLWTPSVHVDRFTMFSEIFREVSLLANLRLLHFVSLVIAL